MKKFVLTISPYLFAVLTCVFILSWGRNSALDFVIYAEAEDSAVSVTEAGVTYYTSEEDAGAALRAKMVKRKSPITIYYLTDEDISDTLVDDLYDIAVEYTGSGFEGDYLFRHIGTYSSTSETDYPCEVTETEYELPLADLENR